MTFKVKLVNLPKIKTEDKGMVPLGNFKVGKKYRVYSVYSKLDFTDFLVADEDGQFFWVNSGVFKGNAR